MTEPAAPAGQVIEGYVSRPDRVSAGVTARASGEPVVVLDETSPTELVIANPDGSWTTDTAPEPVRTVDTATGEWVEIDTTLVEVEGGFAPAAAVGGLVVSDGGDKTFASLDVQDRGLDWKWPDVLPAPVIDGNTATYVGVVGGGDLVVTATPAGFRQDIVLNAPPTDAVSFAVPLVTSGPKLSEAADGSLAVETKAGDELVTASTPVMYDSTTDATGSPENVAVVDATVTKTATGSVLTLSPDQGFLADPDTQYPVTIDPTFTAYPTADTWVGGPNPDGYHPYDEDLYAGTPDSGATKHRSLIQYATGSWAGQQIVSASLKLRNSDAKTCSGSAVRVQQVTSAWKAGTATWNNQPTVAASPYADSSQAFGNGTSCPIADMTWNVTAIVANWAADPATNLGFRVAAVNETINSGYRAFRSANYSTAPGNRPRLITTWNYVPGKPTLPQVSAVNSYAPPGGGSDLYTSTTTPTFSSVVTHPSTGVSVTTTFQVADGGAEVASCTSGAVASGGTASCTLSTALPNPAGLWVRARSSDGTNTGAWSDWAPFTVASGTPGAPTISCPGYADGSWAGSVPVADVSCTISAAGSGGSQAGWIHYSVDGGADQRVLITASSDPGVAKTTVSVPKSPGPHTVTAYAESRSGVPGTSTARIGFGYGVGGMSEPVNEPLVTTYDQVDIAAGVAAVSGTPTWTLQWRPHDENGNATTGWGDVTNHDHVNMVSDASGVWVTGTWDASTQETFPDGSPIPAGRPLLMDVQVCVTSSAGTTCTWSTTPRQVARVPHAFGGNYPVTEVPGGQVALFTGEFATSATDVSINTGGGSLSLSRTHNSFSRYSGSPAAAVFGNGWVASLEGPGTGEASLQVTDNTLTDGTISFTDDASGIAMMFAPKSGSARRTTASLVGSGGASVDWVPLDEATQDAELTGQTYLVGGVTHFKLIEVDGTETVFVATTEPTSSAAAVFSPKLVDEPGPGGVTTYTYDTTGRVLSMVAPLPSGVSCPAPAASSPAWAAGVSPACKGLFFKYATTTTATASTPGDYAGRLAEVWLIKAGSNVSQVKYAYNDSGYLVQAIDTRPATNRTTAYTYSGSGSSLRLTSVTPPGLKTVSYDYSSSAKLQQVTRERPSTDTAGTTKLATVLYSVPTTGTSGLPSMSEANVRAWGQSVTPTYAAAVFGPEAPPSSFTPANLTAGEWASASLFYTDAEGQTLNTAIAGGGSWQYTSTNYNDDGAAVRSLGFGDVDAIRDGRSSAADAGSLTVYNASDISTPNGGTIPAGTVVVDSYGPARYVTLDSGARAWARPKAHTTYDEGAPAGEGAFSLPTTQKMTAVNPATDAELDVLSVVETDYGTVDGWTMGTPTSSTTVMPGSGNDIVAATAYDDQGRITAQSQPKSNGADVGTRQTIYYTAGTNPVSVCGNKPAWDGAVCQYKYGGAPSSGPALPTTTYTYNDYLQPATVKEETGAATRTTSYTYNPDQTVATSAVTLTGLSGSTSVPSITYGYDAGTGLLTTVNPSAGSSITTGYDTWGRVRTYTPKTGETTTTNYDTAGRVSSVSSANGAATYTTTYTYNGTDAAGKSEYRNLVTGISVNGANRAFSITGAYDANGQLTKQTLPGGITQRLTYDNVGLPVSASYSGDVNVSGTVQADKPWVAWSQTRDAAGRVRRDWTPEGAALKGETTGAAGSGYSKDYTYDRATRLVQVTDKTADPVNGVTDPTNCVIRAYTFDKNGSRLTKQTTPAAENGACQTPGTGAVTKSWTYDTADRITGGYSYDQLGRVTTLPQTDTPAGQTGSTPGPGDITLGYYDTDAAKTITQNGQTTSFVLDAAGRRLDQTDGPTGGAATSVTNRHYVDASDNPGWATIGTTIERYVNGLSGGLAATITNGAIELALSDMGGNIPATITLAATGNATGLAAWQTTDEYGNPNTASVGTTPTNPAGASSGIGYSWLGTHQRALAAAGLTLMGARLYNAVNGQFTSTDPVYGGNSTTMSYPGDPINRDDLTGQWCWKCSLVSLAKMGLDVAISKFACLATSGLYLLCRGVVSGVLGMGAYLVKQIWAMGRTFSRTMAARAVVVGVMGFLGGVVGASVKIPYKSIFKISSFARSSIGRVASWMAAHGWYIASRAIMSLGGYVASSMTEAFLERFR